MLSRILGSVAILSSLASGAALFFYVVGQYYLDFAGLHHNHRPLFHAGDFAGFFGAGEFALRGNAAAAYDIAALSQRFVELTGIEGAEFRFAYPPPFLMLLAPFAQVSPPLSYAAWNLLWAASLCLACYLATRRSSALGLAATYYGAIYSAYCGQNGTLTATLYVLFVNFFGRRPILAGVFLGLLAFKPNLALLPFVLCLALRQYRLLFSAAATIGLLAASSVVLFGLQIWASFISELVAQSETLQAGLLQAHQVTPFVAARLVTDNVAICGFIAGAIALLAFASVYYVWKSDTRLEPRALSLAAGMPLFTPYANNYDLAIFSLPFVLAAQRYWDSSAKSWRESVLIFLLGLLPLLNSPGWLAIAPFPPTSIALIALVYVSVARFRSSSLSPRPYPLSAHRPIDE